MPNRFYGSDQDIRRQVVQAGGEYGSVMIYTRASVCAFEYVYVCMCVSVFALWLTSGLMGVNKWQTIRHKTTTDNKQEEMRSAGQWILIIQKQIKHRYS